MKAKIASYIKTWMARGYPEDIPDEVPTALMDLCLAPSYRAICLAILKNDAPLQSLGFTPKKSAAYMAIKRIEIQRRGSK